MKRQLAVLIALAGVSSGAWAEASAEKLLRTVTVSGEATVSAVPDRARLNLGVTEVAPEVATAEAEVNRVVRAYVAEVKKLGAKDEQIGTAGVSIQPEYVWDEKARRNQLTGYRVSRDIEVRVSDLDKLGAYLLAATRAGINQVQPPQLESSKVDELEQQALAAAARDAQSKAALLATTLGAKLGAVRSVSEAGMQPPQPVFKAAMAMRAEAADDNAEMGLETGEIRVHASLTAEFDLIAP
jgi:uncharacterized protein YggE